MRLKRDQIFIIPVRLVEESSKNLWMAARIFCKTSMKGYRNLQTLCPFLSFFFLLSISRSLALLRSLSSFLFLFCFIWLTPSALRKMPPQDPTSQHPLSPDGIYFFFSLANAHPLSSTRRLFLPYFYTPFRFFYTLHRTFFFFFFHASSFPSSTPMAGKISTISDITFSHLIISTL